MGISGLPSSWPIDPKRLAWWNELDSSATVQWFTGRFRYPREFFLVVGAVWVVLVVVLVIWQARFSTALIPLLLWPTLSIVLGALRLPIVIWVLIPAVPTAGMLIITAMYSAGHAHDAPTLTAAVFAALAAFQVGTPLIARAYASAARVERMLTDDIRQCRVFGTPGARLAAARGWRRGAIESGLIGETLTGDLLGHYVTRIPSARIFHSLAWPGSASADVDHAVLCGRRLVLIDSKHWRPGHYTVDPHFGLLRDGRPFYGSRIGLFDAVLAYRRLLPRCDVRGVVLIHPNREGPISIVDNQFSPIQVTTVYGFLAETCGWLACRPDTVDGRAVAVLLGMVGDFGSASC